MSIIDYLRECFTADAARNKIASVGAGILFFLGWWLLIDALSTAPGIISAGEIIIGIFGTISFIMVNTVKNYHLSEVNVSVAQARAAKVWLLIGFGMGFASIIAAIWVMVVEFSKNEEKAKWPGIAILLQNIFILFANLIYKLGRDEEVWNE